MQAHWIRNQNTVQFRAANELKSDRRWCLTGTPIQNSLEDLVSFLRFLKIEPFCGKSANAVFKRRIVDPLSENPKDPCQQLRILLRSFCLRRTAQTSSEITASHEAIKLDASEAEDGQYRQILEQTRNDIDLVVSFGQRAQKFTKLFALVLKLRMLCNHGLYFKDAEGALRSGSTKPLLLSSDMQMGSDLGCGVCQDREFSDLIRGHDFCPSCARLLQPNQNITRLDTETRPSKRLKASFPLGLEGRSISPIESPAGGAMEIDSSNSSYPTKIQAIAANLSEHAETCKRSHRCNT